jgi:ribosome-associated protein
MEIEIYTTYIKLSQFLKLANIIVNGGEGKILIQEGLIKVNGSIEYARGKKLFDGDVVEYENQKYVVVNKNVDKNTAIN